MFKYCSNWAQDGKMDGREHCYLPVFIEGYEERYISGIQDRKHSAASVAIENIAILPEHEKETRAWNRRQRETIKKDCPSAKIVRHPVKPEPQRVEQDKIKPNRVWWLR